MKNTLRRNLLLTLGPGASRLDKFLGSVFYLFTEIQDFFTLCVTTIFLNKKNQHSITTIPLKSEYKTKPNKKQDIENKLGF